MHLGDSMRVTFFVSSEDGGSSKQVPLPRISSAFSVSRSRAPKIAQ